jgi:hypothetical protein
MKSAALCCLMFATVALWAGEKPKPCTTEDATRAEEEASSLRSWAEVFRSYRNFAQCDDAGIGEGYSDSIARLLSDHWTSVNQLSRLAAHDPHFEQFALRHVDELMSPAQAEKIRESVESRCPATAKALRGMIAARIKEIGQ